MTGEHCRFCGTPLETVFADLGLSPLANALLSEDHADTDEPRYPLCARVCESCYLVQLPEFAPPTEIFADYVYLSSYSSSWLEHARRYTEQIVARLDLGPQSQVVEIGSNDGYLLRYFRDRGIPVLGIEPAANVAAVARRQAIPTHVDFFGARVAEALAPASSADLLIANNVLAHVPRLNDFVQGLKIVLKAGGVITVEFPHLLRLIERRQWDTIYHEHFSYFSLLTVCRVFAAADLRVFDVEELSSHGGSLRIYVCHAESTQHPESVRVDSLRELERASGLESLATYSAFGGSVAQDRDQILQMLRGLHERGLRLVGYGAPAKGNTLLNYCGIHRDLIAYTCDRNPLKQGRLLPGSRIPVRAPEVLSEDHPDVIVILPWNLKEEIIDELAFVRSWGARFAVRDPELVLVAS